MPYQVRADVAVVSYLRMVTAAEDPERPLRGVPSSRTADPGPPNHGGDHGDDARKDAETALAILKDLSARETVRSERASGRARHAFTLAAGFFAVAQTVSFSSFNQEMLSPTERQTIVDMAWGAGIVLAVCAGLLMLFEMPYFWSRTLTTDQVLDAYQPEDPADRKHATTTAEFVSMYATVVDSERDANKVRFVVSAVVQFVALAAIGLTTWELLHSLTYRASNG